MNIRNKVPVDLTVYSVGEDFVLHLFARDRQGAPLQATASAIAMVIAPSCGAAPIIEISGGPAVTQLDAPTSLFEVKISRNSLAALKSTRRYAYDIWAEVNGDRLHQVGGALQLNCATPPT